MIQCLICNKEYKKITALHVRTHGIELEEYELLKKSREKYANDEIDVVDTTDDGDFKEIEEGVVIEKEVEYTYEPVEVSYDERIDSIFKDSTEPNRPDRPIGEFLAEFDITEKELRRLVKQYKGGDSISITQGIENKTKRGDIQAEIVKDRDMVETRDSYTAEKLEANYGFTCTEVRSGPPKIWVLRKQ